MTFLVAISFGLTLVVSCLLLVVSLLRLVFRIAFRATCHSA
jgi:hypothetical protein